ALDAPAGASQDFQVVPLRIELEEDPRIVDVGHEVVENAVESPHGDGLDAVDLAEGTELLEAVAIRDQERTELGDARDVDGKRSLPPAERDAMAAPAL